MRDCLESILARPGVDERLRTLLAGLRERVEESQRIRRLADALPAYVSYIDASQRYVFLNQTYAESFRRPAQDLQGRTVAEVLGPDNYASVRANVEAALGGQLVRAEQALRLPDGGLRHFDANYVPDLRADGTVAGCFVMVIEVTERKQAVDLTHRVLDNLFAFVAILEPNATVIDVNATSLTTAGLTLDEVRGKKFWDCYWWSFSPQSQARMRDACERAARGETLRYDVPVRIAGDAQLIADFQLAPLRDDDGRITHLIPSGVDVTERKRTEQILRESEERLRIAKDAAQLGIHDVDLRTRTVRWDGRVRALWGIGPDEPITFERFVAGVHPDDRKLVEAAIEHAFDPVGGGNYLVEHRVINPIDEQTRWIAVTGQTTFEGDDAVRMVGTMQDITARKQAEQELFRSQAQLRESDRRKDEFLAMLGHELRNPLAAIRSASELLQVYSSADPRLERVSDVLDRQSNHMVRLIDGLLEVSRIARGKINLEWGPVDLRAVLQCVIADRRDQLASGRLELDAQLPNESVWVWGDEVRLAQVFDNLVSNAIKFTAAPGRVNVSLARTDDSVEVVVSDTGVGLRPDMLETIFEPFTQDAQQIARSAGGLGIGLSLVRGLVELHHGTVVARSEGPGKGARFEVRLPATTTARSLAPNNRTQC